MLRFDRDDYIIPIFSGVNDNPIAPSANNNANADYFIERFNLLVNDFDFDRQDTPILTASFYVSALSGNDNNNGTSNLTPFLTLSRLNVALNELTLGNTSVVNIFLEGAQSVIDLRGLYSTNSGNFSQVNLNSFGSGYTINVSNEDLFLLPSNNSVSLKVSNAIFNLTGQVSIDSYSKTVIDIVDSTFNLNTINTSIYVNNTYLKITNGSFTQNSATTIFYTGSNSVINMGGAITFNVSATTFLNTFLTGGSFYLRDDFVATFPSASFNAYFGDPISAGIIFIGDNGFPLSAIGDLDSNLVLTRSNDLDIKYAVQRINSLTGADRIDGSAIQNLTNNTAEQTRDLLETLTGLDRLDASAIQGFDSYNLFTQVSSNFTQPAVGASVLISVAEGRWVTQGNFILIQGGGLYEVVSSSASNMTIINTGAIGNAAPGSTIFSGFKITLTGKPGLDVFTNTALDFQLPAIGDNVQIEFSNPEPFVIGSVILIAGVDAFQVTSEISATVLDCFRLGYYTSVPVGNTILAGTKATLTGLKGGDGDSSITFTTADFVVPDVGNNVTVDVIDSAFVSTGLPLFIENAGYYRVVSATTSPDTITLTNLGLTGNASFGANITTGSKITVSGEPGRGTSTVTTSLFNIPLVNTSVTIDVIDSNVFTVGAYVTDGNSVFQVVAINSDTSLDLLNLDISSNEPDGTSIPIGTQYTITGVPGIKGDTGDTGSTGTSSFTLTDASFNMPAAFNTVNVSVENSDGFATSLNVYIENAGFFRIANISGNLLNLFNLGLPVNSLVGTSVPVGSKVIICGLIGNGIVTPIADFNVPLVNSTVTVSTQFNTEFFSVDSYVFIPKAGYFKIQSKTGGSLTLLNEFFSTNAPPTTPITNTQAILQPERPVDEVIVSSTAYTQPVINTTVNVSVETVSNAFPGDILAGENAGYYEIVSVLNSTTLVLKNLGYGLEGEQVFGTTISPPVLFKKVAPRGLAGINAGLAPFLITTDGDTATSPGIYIIDNGISTFNLPTIPTDGDRIIIVDRNGNFSTTPLTVDAGTGLLIIDSQTTVLDKDYDSIALTYYGGVWYPFGGSGSTGSGGLEALQVTTDNFISASNTIMVVATGVNTIFLPTTPVNGDRVVVVDGDSRFDISPLTLDAGAGELIFEDQTLVLDSKYATISLIYWNKWLPLGTEVFLNGGSGGSNLTVELVTTDVSTLNANTLSLIATGVNNVSLPAVPDNTLVTIADYDSRFSTTSLTITPNGMDTIINSPNLVLNTNDASVQLVYYQGNWTLYGSGTGTTSTDQGVLWFYN